MRTTRHVLIAYSLIALVTTFAAATEQTAVIDPAATTGIRISAEVDSVDPARIACTVEWTRGAEEARIRVEGAADVVPATSVGEPNRTGHVWTSGSFPVKQEQLTAFVVTVPLDSGPRPAVVYAERVEGEAILQSSVALEAAEGRVSVSPQRNFRLLHESFGDGRGTVTIDHLGAASIKAQAFAEDPTNRNIPDGPSDCSGSSTVWPMTTTINISSAPPGAIATAVEARLIVDHPVMADLQIVFSRGFYSVALYLWKNGSGVNLDQVFTSDLYGQPLPGVGQEVNATWVLAARDCYAADTGYLDYWSVRIDYAGGTTVDLVADSASVDPATVQAGDTVEVDWAGHVAGTGSVAGPFNVGFYLSNDANITTGDVFLGQMTESSASNPGDSFGESSPGRQLTIPAGTSDGSYYLGIIIDSGGAIGESNESNNVTTAPLTVTSGGGSTCQSGVSQLSLQNGRFTITGGAFLGGVPTDFFLQNLCPNGVPSETAAAFYFNIALPPVQEGFVSIRNGCSSPRNAYIVEVACASTRKFYIDVTDTWTSTTHRYENPTGGSSVCFPADAVSFQGSCP